ncbi:MAG: alpha/beta hydrolase, partial [Cyanobacteriota bacterium]|nr:alpha/beta hydrolase [Cyanobacteriota bacterium]
LFGLCSSIFTIQPAYSAEKIQFFYGPVGSTIEIKELEEIAKTGKLENNSSILDNYLSDEQLVLFQSLLNTRFEIDVVGISQISYSSAGSKLLERLGQIIQTENSLNGFKALRAALIFAADDEEGLTVMNVIRQFPLETIQINLPLTLKLAKENQEIFEKQTGVVANIRKLAESKAEKLAVKSLNTDPRKQGNYTWDLKTFPFQNPSRSQISSADLYLPNQPSNSSNQIPVAVISHGTASNRQTFAYLAKHLASHGYAVVVPEHLETSTQKFSKLFNGLEGPPDPNTLLLLPKDITAVLDELERRAKSEPELQSLNLQAVGVFGQSLGGYTVLASAGAELSRDKLENVCLTTVEERPILNTSMLLQCRLLEVPAEKSLTVKDKRIKAVIAINPFTSHIFGETGLNNLQAPVLFVAGTDDYFVPALPEQIKPFQQLQIEDKYLVVMENGTHFSTLEMTEDGGGLPVPESLIGANPKKAQPQINSLSLAFFNRYILNQTESEMYLNQSYLNTFNPEPFRFSIVKDFSE